MGKKMQGLAVQRRAKRLFLFLALLCLGSAPALAQPTPQGWWLDQTGRAGILIAACGTQLCGRIEWLKVPLDTENHPKTDIHNPDSTLQVRPLCGLQMLGGFVPDGNGGWTGGWIYDPEKGKTYKSAMHLAADGTLRVRGYIGIPLLGRSATWTRPPAPLPQCATPK
jgi:uncharacterized protein (DUF2147 family)